jgi:hypothetical protein
MTSIVMRLVLLLPFVAPMLLMVAAFVVFRRALLLLLLTLLTLSITWRITTTTSTRSIIRIQVGLEGRIIICLLRG